MSFEEVLEALSEDSLLSLLRTFKMGDPFPNSAHARLLELQRIYFLTGGMPEAVKCFIESDGDFNEVFDVHSSIAETYKDDFSKYSRGSALQMLHRIYEFIPRSIGEKFKYSRVNPDVPAREIRKALELLVKAQLVMKAHHSDGVGIPLGSSISNRTFKAFFLDCGLVNHICGIRRISIGS